MISNKTLKKVLQRVIKTGIMALLAFLVALEPGQFLKPKVWIMTALIAFIAGLQKRISGYLKYDKTTK